MHSKLPCRSLCQKRSATFYSISVPRQPKLLAGLPLTPCRRARIIEIIRYQMRKRVKTAINALNIGTCLQHKFGLNRNLPKKLIYRNHYYAYHATYLILNTYRRSMKRILALNYESSLYNEKKSVVQGIVRYLAMVAQ